jgi:hypothetical protein
MAKLHDYSYYENTIYMLNCSENTLDITPNEIVGKQKVHVKQNILLTYAKSKFKINELVKLTQIL